MSASVNVPLSSRGKLASSLPAEQLAEITEAVGSAIDALGGRFTMHYTTLAISALVTDWHGQGAVSLPGITVERTGGALHFSATIPGSASSAHQRCGQRWPISTSCGSPLAARRWASVAAAH